MGRHLVPAAMAAAMLALAVAALAAGLASFQPGWWRGAVSLAILGGIIPMIFAVNVRIVPVFSRRAWLGEIWLRAQVGLAVAGAWVVFAGIIARQEAVVSAGHALALGGGILFVVNVARLFRQPATMPAPPLPYPGQAAVDRVATRFMRLSGGYLLFGLAVGLLMSVWQPGMGRWDLVWAHALLIGYFLAMVSGVCYHVLSRWTGRAWKRIGPIRLHFLAVALGLPLMLLALATDQRALFAIAGSLQAIALGLLLVNIAPMISGLPGLTRPAFAAAMVMLLVGITLGALFALDPALGARLRLTHAEINLFGWTGLLISGAGYYLVPRFAGQPLRWPRLAPLQLGLLVAGIGLAVVALLWRTYGDGPAALVLLAQALVAAGYLLFGVLVAGTFRPTKRAGAGTVAALPLAPRPAIGTGPR